MSTIRIQADFHGIVPGVKNPDNTAIVLDTIGSLRSLSNAGIRLSEGLPLTVFDEYDDGESMERHGTAQYAPVSPSGGQGWWVVEFDEPGFRVVPAIKEPHEAEHNCVACKHSLLDQIKRNGLKLGDMCFACGTPIHAPIAPPASQ